MHQEGSQDTFSALIVGASGYAGGVLHALLTQHPCIDVQTADGRRDPEEVLSELEQIPALVCLALPSAVAKVWAPLCLAYGIPRVLDLSDAHRLDPQVHYGLPELFGAPPADQALVANPGCYPTATLLALKPLLDVGAIAASGIAVHGQSGASGAGKQPSDELHFCHLADNLFPYKVGEHRHTPEIETHLDASVSLVTTLLPLVRGLAITAFVRPRLSPLGLKHTLQKAYAEAQYVTVLEAPGPELGLRHRVGSHEAVVAVGPQMRSGLVPVFCAIDNLMRGAASQALVNLNLWLGLPPAMGLHTPGEQSAWRLSA